LYVQYSIVAPIASENWKSWELKSVLGEFDTLGEKSAGVVVVLVNSQ